MRVRTHPGQLLLDTVFPAMNLDLQQASEKFDIPMPTLEAILRSDAPVTEDVAKKLAAHTNNSSEFWLRMQENHDHSRQNMHT